MNLPIFNSPIFFWAGWALSALVTVFLIFSFIMYMLRPQVPTQMQEELGLPKGLVPLIGTMEGVIGVIYGFPPTAVLGAILVTGLFAGTYTVHFRMGRYTHPSQIMSIALAVMAWGGLWLRDGRVRAILPFN